MWLVNCTTLKLQYFIGSNIPKYAILSHTWEQEEVTFQELDLHHPGNVDLPAPRLRQHIYDTTPKGYHKIWETCFKAKKHGFEYAWIDTCCINKDSSAELTESINSMFQWYQNAEECYVFLSDLSPGISAEEWLPKCKWFTRGWTLQELIAPKKVLFYNQAWKYVGSKTHFCNLISQITNIDKGVLRGTTPAWNFSTSTRMSWAAHRKTTRVEDIAYCLLGIFQVNLPMIYGEGSNAFFRLQEEIVRRTNDLTVFAWEQKEEQLPCVLFASSPLDFAESGRIGRVPGVLLAPVFSITNKGLRLDSFKQLWKLSIDDADGGAKITYAIPLGFLYEQGSYDPSYDCIAMKLRKIGPDLFIRTGKLLKSPWKGSSGAPISFHLYLEPPKSHDGEEWNRPIAIYFPSQVFQTSEVLLESHWNAAEMLFYAPVHDQRLVLAARGTVSLGDSRITLILCIEFSLRLKPWVRCRIFDAKQHHKLASWLFRHNRFGHDVTWDDVNIDQPEILEFTDHLETVTNGTGYRISVSARKGVVPAIGANPFFIDFNIE